MSSETDVWVNDYTTSAGVQVAGHWRRRRPADDVENGGQPALRSSHEPPEGAPPPRLVAAESRYRAALVAAGVSALRMRRGEPTDHQAALQERAAARVELEAAHQEVVHDDSSGHGHGNGVPANRCPGCGQYRGSEHQCPTPAGLPDGDYAGLNGDARVKAMVADLEASVKAIVESGQLHRWLDAMASNGLNRWSANNRLLAAVQMLQRGESLEQLHLMGFRQWQKFNRQVSKGAKAVWILAPVTRKVVEEASDGTTSEGHRVVGFKGVAVFNVSVVLLARVS